MGAATNLNNNKLKNNMGYDTDFAGEFKLDKPLTEAQVEYLRAFSNSRRMLRDRDIVADQLDPKRDAVELRDSGDPQYFVGGSDYGDPSILDHNCPPVSQPGLWCQWIPNDEGTAIVWDESEKFYNYKEWLIFLLQHFLIPWGYVLSGAVKWQGEDAADAGILRVIDNVVSTTNDTAQFSEADDLKEFRLTLTVNVFLKAKDAYDATSKVITMDVAATDVLSREVYESSLIDWEIAEGTKAHH